jgi:hypothetical protein
MKKLQYCDHCGSFNEGKHRGSWLLFWFLLIFFAGIPGLFYLWWMLANGKVKCRSCDKVGMIPADSPKAKAEIDRLNQSIPVMSAP